LPHCLGHEGSGIVREISSGVTKVKEGDRAILSWIKGSGANVPGCVYRWGDYQVNAGAITTFSRYSVLSENRLTLLPEGFPMKEAALLGCALPTGIGSVLNTGGAKAGQSAACLWHGGRRSVRHRRFWFSPAAHPSSRWTVVAERLTLAARVGCDPSESTPASRTPFKRS